MRNKILNFFLLPVLLFFNPNALLSQNLQVAEALMKKNIDEPTNDDSFNCAQGNSQEPDENPNLPLNRDNPQIDTNARIPQGSSYNEIDRISLFNSNSNSNLNPLRPNGNNSRLGENLLFNVEAADDFSAFEDPRENPPNDLNADPLLRDFIEEIYDGFITKAVLEVTRRAQAPETNCEDYRLGAFGASEENN